MPELAQLQSAFAARDWYALAVLGLVLGMRYATQTNAWAKVPRQYQPAVPVLAGAVAGLGDAFASGAPWKLAIVQAVGAGLQIGLGAVGVHHAAKRVKPGAAAAVVLLLCPMLTGCSALGLAPADNAKRDECLAAVFVEMTNRANAECLARGIGLAECPARDSIVADSLARQLSCLQ